MDSTSVRLIENLLLQEYRGKGRCKRMQKSNPYQGEVVKSVNFTKKEDHRPGDGFWKKGEGGAYGEKLHRSEERNLVLKGSRVQQGGDRGIEVCSSGTTGGRGRNDTAPRRLKPKCRFTITWSGVVTITQRERKTNSPAREGETERTTASLKKRVAASE